MLLALIARELMSKICLSPSVFSRRRCIIALRQNAILWLSASTRTAAWNRFAAFLRGAIDDTATAILRKLSPANIRGICALTGIITLAAIIVSYASAAGHMGRSAFGEVLGADFVAFYDAGVLINDYGSSRLYDLALQAKIYHDNFPFVPANSLNQFQNAPFLALPLPALAQLPYPLALCLWQLVSLALYIAGFTILWRELKTLGFLSYRVALLAAVTFMPFMTECLAGGQTTAFGFFCIAAALVLEARGRYLGSGFMIALLSYKPTLLLLIFPMLVISRRWRQLGGFVAGITVLATSSLAFGGRQILTSWLQALIYTGHNATGSGSQLRLWKYVDLNAFAHGLIGDHPVARWTTAAALAVPIAAQLTRLWWRADRNTDADKHSPWTATLAWLPVINLYVGIYDATIVVLSAVFLAAQQVRRHGRLQPGYRLCITALYVLPWLSEPLARRTGLQLYTLALSAWGLYVLREDLPHSSHPRGAESDPLVGILDGAKTIETLSR